jgi:hypothetical protein
VALEERNEQPDLYHIFNNGNRFNELLGFRKHQIRLEASMLLNILKTYEEQYKYLDWMQDRTQADLRVVSLKLYNQGLGPVLISEPGEMSFTPPSAYTPAGLFANGWYEHALFSASAMELSSVTERDASDHVSVDSRESFSSGSTDRELFEPDS